MGLEPDERRGALESFIAAAARAHRTAVRKLERLAGGAVADNWLVEVEIAGGPRAGAHRLVLRTDAPSAIAESHSRAHEFRILEAAFAAGVRVPEPLWLCEDRSVTGRPFYLSGWLPGTAAGHLVVRAPGLDGATLAERLGEELARIHAITPEGALGLEFLEPPEPSPALRQVARSRRYLDAHPLPHPVLEWGLRWLERNAPPKGEIVLAHRDFRTGNYLVDSGRLAGILDWEFADWSDPMEDLGWFCARCWRFGVRDREAGGIAPRAPFYRGYERGSGRRVEPAAVHYWEVMAHARWAAIAILQGDRHVSGGERSL
ncbi:MAG: phosphotransferase family protein, partial [Alphaproteobacteria bacterium]